MIPYNQIQAGDILIFKREGPVSGVFGWLLKRFERKWDGWGWHMAIAWQKARHRYWILEAAAGGVRVNLITEEQLKTEEIKAYRWLDQPASGDDLEDFMAVELLKGYDAAVYFWTVLQYLILHFFNHRIPRVLNDRYTCWELAFAFAREMGKPIQSIHKYPIITDFLKAHQQAQFQRAAEAGEGKPPENQTQ